MPNVPHQIVSSTTSTSGAPAAQILAPQPGKVFKNAMLYNPPGSGAGQWSDDGFKNSINGFAAGPSATHMFELGNLGSGVSVRRTTATDVSNAVVVAF